MGVSSPFDRANMPRWQSPRWFSPGGLPASWVIAFRACVTSPVRSPRGVPESRILADSTLPLGSPVDPTTPSRPQPSFDPGIRPFSSIRVSDEKKAKRRQSSPSTNECGRLSKLRLDRHAPQDGAGPRTNRRLSRPSLYTNAKPHFQAKGTLEAELAHCATASGSRPAWQPWPTFHGQVEEDRCCPPSIAFIWVSWTFGAERFTWSPGPSLGADDVRPLLLASAARC